jgi:hypothetical protein
MPSPLLLLTKDLLFITKVKEVALATGREVTTIKSEKALEEALNQCVEPGLLLVDLEKSVLPLEALSSRTQGLIESGWRCVSFFSHVHADLEERANSLGLGEVMPRSRFVKMLPELFHSQN